MSRYITLKGKTKQKPPKVEEASEGKTAQPGGKTVHHGCGVHHGQTVAATTAWLWCPLVVVACCFPCAAFWGHLVLRLEPWVLPFLGSFAPPCKLLLILMAHTSLAWIHLKHFSQNLGLNHRNLQ